MSKGIPGGVFFSINVCVFYSFSPSGFLQRDDVAAVQLLQLAVTAGSWPVTRLLWPWIECST